MCLDGKRNDQMAFHALADYQNHVIGWLQWEQSPLGDGAVVRFPRIWMSSGECRVNPFSTIFSGTAELRSTLATVMVPRRILNASRISSVMLTTAGHSF